MKYKQFVATTATVHPRLTDVEEFVVLKKGDNGIMTEHVFHTEALALDAMKDGDYVFSRMKKSYTVQTHSRICFSEAGALGAIDHRLKQVHDDDGFKAGVVGFGSDVSSEIMDADDWEEYTPSYDVDLEVIIKKHITVRVEHEEGLVDDEWDARRIAVENAENGEYEYQIEEAYDYDMDIDDLDCEIVDN